jgi:hypothetical protein
MGKGYSSSNGTVLNKVMDYDHKNGDEIYILFYEYQDNSLQDSSESISQFGIYGTGNDERLIKSDQGLAELIQSFGWDGYPSHNRVETRIINTGYVMTYKINSVLYKIDLGISFLNLHNRTSVWDNLRILSDGYSYEVDWTRSENNSTEGQRITGVSSQINDKNMVYTYIVERYDNNKWVFKKRIVGIINISDRSLPIGHREEFELDFSGTNFDFKSLAAIGITK